MFQLTLGASIGFIGAAVIIGLQQMARKFLFPPGGARGLHEDLLAAARAGRVEAMERLRELGASGVEEALEVAEGEEAVRWLRAWARERSVKKKPRKTARPTQ
ncbi:MAG: hypothetical protein AB2556_19730 [Candidatus Thiodiazotropha sp.]